MVYLSSLGIYAVCPGTDEYVIGSPLFKKATITLENGNKFVIEAPENSKENLYIQSATLNGRLLDKNFIRYNDISDGGVLKLRWVVSLIRKDVLLSMRLPSRYLKKTSNEERSSLTGNTIKNIKNEA